MDAGRDGRFDLRPVDGAAGCDRGAGFVERVAHRFKDERATVVTNERSDPVVGEQPIHGGKSGEGRDTCQGSRSLIVAGQRAAAREAVSY